MKVLKKKKSNNNFSIKSQILYSSGGMGFSIVGMIWISFMLYLYLPPEGSGMTQLISNETSWFFLPTSILIILFARIVEAVSNPIIGHLSDRSESRLGRRKTFLFDRRYIDPQFLNFVLLHQLEKVVYSLRRPNQDSICQLSFQSPPLQTNQAYPDLPHSNIFLLKDQFQPINVLDYF